MEMRVRAAGLLHDGNVGTAIGIRQGFLVDALEKPREAMSTR